MSIFYSVKSRKMFLKNVDHYVLFFHGDEKLYFSRKTKFHRKINNFTYICPLK